MQTVSLDDFITYEPNVSVNNWVSHARDQIARGAMKEVSLLEFLEAVTDGSVPVMPAIGFLLDYQVLKEEQPIQLLNILADKYAHVGGPTFGDVAIEIENLPKPTLPEAVIKKMQEARQHWRSVRPRVDEAFLQQYLFETSVYLLLRALTRPDAGHPLSPIVIDIWTEQAYTALRKAFYHAGRQSDQLEIINDLIANI